MSFLLYDLFLVPCSALGFEDHLKELGFRVFSEGLASVQSEFFSMAEPQTEYKCVCVYVYVFIFVYDAYVYDIYVYGMYIYYVYDIYGIYGIYVWCICI